MKRTSTPLPLATLFGLGASVLAVLFIALFSYRSLTSRAESAARVTESLEILEQLEATLSTLKDAETGQRGFLLTGNESYLEPFNEARANLGAELGALRGLLKAPDQLRRLDQVSTFASDMLSEIEQTIELRREARADAALALVQTDRGRNLMERLRALIAQMEARERESLGARQEAWQDAVGFSAWVAWGGSALLLFCIIAAGAIMSRDHRARARQTWLQLGQVGLSQRMQGEQRLEQLGGNVLEFLAQYLDAQLGSIYIAERGSFRRFGGYALPAPADSHETVRAGDGLLGQAAQNLQPMRVEKVPEGFFAIESSLGRANAAELLLAPAVLEGRTRAVIELAFFRAVDAVELELLAMVSESIAVAVRSSKDRTRLEELLEETQRQAEELQTQQEELRVSNEELAEQGQVLKEAQSRLENSQAELEQTNAQLEEQTQILEYQKDELSRAQETLLERARDLERTNQYKSEFLANMSHELRTPLNSSLILAKLLADNKDGNLTAEQVRFAQTIASAGNDLLALINDILDLSRIESGKIDLQIETVPLVPAVEEVLKTLQPVAVEKGLSLALEVAEGAPAQLETDPQRLGQILKNLLANAVKFTEKGSVTVTVSAAHDGFVDLAVRDTGIGIAAHHQQAIFEAFRQADGSTHRKYGGTGLGLSISRDLAQRLGGEIRVQSAPGEGSTFTLRLPLALSNPRAEAPPAPAPAPAPTRAATPRRGSTPPRPKDAPAPKPDIEDDRDALSDDARVILVIEDDLAFAAVLRDLARELGFQCIATQTADDGLWAAENYRVSAILLDMNLPDHSGMGVLDQLKSNPATRHIPVHVASVDDFSREALELGAVGYALKPVPREELVRAIRTLEQKFSQALRRVLVVEDDARQRESVRQLLSTNDVEIVDVATATEALAALRASTFDCMVMDLSLPDLSGYELLERMSGQDDIAFPPVIVYTGRSLTRDEEHRLGRFSKSIIIKDARSPERLLDEVTLFLHQVETKLSPERQRMLKEVRKRDAALEGRRILVVEDDVRNVFALSSLLEPKGVKIEIARNGKEALTALSQSQTDPAKKIDLVLMDLMMPEMDGLTAMREIRKRPEWRKLPIIALTAKAMKDDQQQSLTAGANDYIAKPLDVEKLLSLVRVWMPK
jgi:signal transduction histidine kinase/DNA-binding response OmpR family regulator/CHASE3 domain sensor protein